jgi:cation diffusion facilitator family transporter
VAEKGGVGAVAAALGANVGIAVTKLIAWLLTGSSSMLAESVHSLADSGNQILLLVGRRRADRPATSLHPFGFGRVRYLYSFLVAIVLFSVGGLFSLYEGYDRFRHPEPITGFWWWVPIAVVVVAFVLEGFSLRTAVVASGARTGPASWLRFVRRTKSPDLPVVLLEDSAAVVGLVAAGLGVVATLVTGDGRWDGVGSFVIGLILVVVAATLAREMASLLLGESARPGERAAIESALVGDGIESLIEARTVQIGPDEVFVVARVRVTATASTPDVVRALAAAKERVMAAVPTVRNVYLEPGITSGEGTASQGAVSK